MEVSQISEEKVNFFTINIVDKIGWLCGKKKCDTPSLYSKNKFQIKQM